jgi:hypothetical protein
VLVVRAVIGAAGLVLALAGIVFFFQGVGVIGGSFMSGSATWAVIGVLLVAGGVGLLAVARFRA